MDMIRPIDKQSRKVTDLKEPMSRLIEGLQPYCSEIKVGGSIRRGEVFVTDVEILAKPRTENIEDLFGDVQTRRNLLWEHMNLLRTSGVIQLRLDKNGHSHFGERSMRFTFEKIPFDLFCCLPPASWGAMMAIRTGPADFSKWLVTKVGQGGAMPVDMRMEDFRLVRSSSVASGNLEVLQDVVIDTPTEQDFFAALGIGFIEPTMRRSRVREPIRTGS